MASASRYTDEHAKAGLDFAFPAIETWPNQFPGYEILIDDPELTSVCPNTTVVDSDNLNLLWAVVLRSLPWRSDYRVGSVSCCGRMA